jgi:glucokinase
MIVAGDVGGTKTVVALFDEAGGGLRLVRDATFPSQGHGSLEEILAKFLEAEKGLALRAGCFGVAGAVIDGRSQTTNLPWHLDEQELARAVRARQVRLLNDLEAAAYGMLHLEADELVPLNPGAGPRRKGNVAVIAAGTGLGEAILFWDGQQHHPLASEGGHCDFAPRTDQEIELLRYLRARFDGHVSYERILSGPGLYNVFCFLRDSGAHAQTPALAERLQAGGDPSATVTELGLSGQDPLCAATLDLFCELYGAEAGNLALKCVSVGGVFVGGGIAPKILPALRKGGFLQAFTDKGRFRHLLEGLEVNVALNPRAPLLGAAHYAARMA